MIIKVLISIKIILLKIINQFKASYTSLINYFYDYYNIFMEDFFK